jgi:hypothetical protein
MTHALDVLMWCWCRVAYAMVMRLPISWCDPILPYAGFYGYHEPGVTPWRWSMRVRLGQEAILPPPPGDAP